MSPMNPTESAARRRMVLYSPAFPKIDQTYVDPGVTDVLVMPTPCVPFVVFGISLSAASSPFGPTMASATTVMFVFVQEALSNSSERRHKFVRCSSISRPRQILVSGSWSKRGTLAAAVTSLPVAS
ncbi:hypothetical protein D9M69_482890 [compost metagenome]